MSAQTGGFFFHVVSPPLPECLRVCPFFLETLFFLPYPGRILLTRSITELDNLFRILLDFFLNEKSEIFEEYMVSGDPLFAACNQQHQLIVLHYAVTTVHVQSWEPQPQWLSNSSRDHHGSSACGNRRQKINRGMIYPCWGISTCARIVWKGTTLQLFSVLFPPFLHSLSECASCELALILCSSVLNVFMTTLSLARKSMQSLRQQSRQGAAAGSSSQSGAAGTGGAAAAAAASLFQDEDMIMNPMMQFRNANSRK